MAVMINTAELKETLSLTPTNQNIMLVGKHGIGKSEILTEHFKKEGMVFHPESNDPFQRFQLEILGAVASFERNLIRERQREGIALAKKRNAYAKCGRPAALTEEQMDELQERLKNGEKVAELAKEYGISRQTIYKFIRLAVHT